jgi:two-component system nitrogen regulation sensor histidine kinase NtrY
VVEKISSSCSFTGSDPLPSFIMPYFRRLLILTILCCLSFLAAMFSGAGGSNLPPKGEEFQKTVQSALDDAQAKLEKGLVLFSERASAEKSGSADFNDLVGTLDMPANTFLFVFDKQEMVFWSSNTVAPSFSDVSRAASGSLYVAGNGYYLLAKKQSGERLLTGLTLIEHKYQLQNKFLNDRFNPALGIPVDVKLEQSLTAGATPFYNRQDVFLFALRAQDDPVEQSSPPLYGWCLGMGLFILFLLLAELLWRNGQKPTFTGHLAAGGMLITRLFMSWWQFPAGLFNTDFFRPEYYASGFLLNSPGELLLTAGTLSLMVIYLYSLVVHAKENGSHRCTITGAVVFLIGTFLFSVLVNYLVSGLIIHSQISFDIRSIVEFSIYSVAGLGIISILLGTFYMLCDGCILYLEQSSFPARKLIGIHLASQAVFLAVILAFREADLFENYSWSAYLLANILLLFIGYIRRSDLQLYSFTRTVLAILVFSIYAAQTIYAFNQTREREKRKLIAEKLENEQDIIAEYQLVSNGARLVMDSELIRLLTYPAQVLAANPGFIEDAEKHVQRYYFSGYLQRYAAAVKLFNIGAVPVNTAGDPSWNLDTYRQKCSAEGKATQSEFFYYFRNENGKSGYIGILPIGKDGQIYGTLVVELEARSSSDDGGLPELLMSDKTGNSKNLKNYSFARYQQGRLIQQSGTFNYLLSSSAYSRYVPAEDEMCFAHFDGFSHLLYSNNGNLTIVSTPLQGFWMWVTGFSYLFTIFSVTYLAISFLLRLSRQGWKPRFSFTNRIQIAIVIIAVGTLLVIGATTVGYLIRNYQETETQRLRENLNNLRVLIENEMSDREHTGPTLSDDLQFKFGSLSGTLKTDFNFYNTAGKLYHSSQQSIYDQGIIAPLMNPQALQQLARRQNALYMQSERIGELKYTAAYEPVRNKKNKVLGYVSIPYFDREADLKQNISGFLVALINIYVLLFSVASLIAFFISGRITQPLLILQESLRKMKLGEKNEPIRWTSKDEIGDLINEYNRMLDELQKSALLLARSERESAWREMAKQVAHEIKNPLTPMKLGIQHLQRAIEDNHPEKEALVKRIGTTIIEQIDALANIATEFSHFAQMPRGEYARVGIVPLMEQVCDLYKEEGQASIVFQKPGEDFFVHGDKNQLQRIFGNLLKNAQQAIPDDRKGLIEINVCSKNGFVEVKVQDNGTGIPTEKQSLIFVPNFTTKSGGTGLGLAMVKAMTEGMGGTVHFETRVGEGSTFIVHLPTARD